MTTTLATLFTTSKKSEAWKFLSRNQITLITRLRSFICYAIYPPSPPLTFSLNYYSTFPFFLFSFFLDDVHKDPTHDVALQINILLTLTVPQCLKKQVFFDVTTTITRQTKDGNITGSLTL